MTFQPQPGNQRPRLFRLPADRALINRAGFNIEGALEFARRLANGRPTCPLGVSIGKSKVTPLENAIDDYLASFDAVFPVADYVAVNVSSPNTPDLRELQRADQLERLLVALNAKSKELSKQTQRSSSMPLLVKLAPDLQELEIELIVDVARRQRIAGIIATNTTIDRPNLLTPVETINRLGAGGLSGAPLRKRSTNIIAYLYKLTKGSIPLIGVGGIFDYADAWEKICAGASLIQIYTGLIYEGPRIVHKINQGLARMIAQNGLRSLDEAVGSQATKFV